MQQPDPKTLRRAKTEDVRRILSAAPDVTWTAPREALDGVDFEVRTDLDVERLQQAFPAQFRGLRDLMPQGVERRVRVRSVVSHARTDDLDVSSGAAVGTFGLAHKTLGAVYVDERDKRFVQFSAAQLPQAAAFAAPKAEPLEWSVSKRDAQLTLSVRGPVSLDVLVDVAARAEASPDVASRILAACLPGLDGLEELGLPLGELAIHGLPATVETWLVDGTGKRLAKLARHRVAIRAIGPIDAAVFAIPSGFRDLRDGKPKNNGKTWHPLRIRHRRLRRTRVARQARASARQQATIGSLVPPRFEFATEPALPECLPATLQVATALEIRQHLLDAIRYLVNTMTRRLATVSGSRVDPGDPDNTDVELTVDWLAQLERFHRDRGDDGDGLFCLLRDPPPEGDATAGGSGLLDRLARTLARELIAAEDPIPLGGADDPIALPQAIEDEISTIADDDAIAPEDRFDALSAASQAAVREAVLARRIATIDYRFDGDFGERVWPYESYDLIHAKLQLERLDVAFRDDDAIRTLAITLQDGDANRPRIEFELALARFDATIAMDRWPGGMFWITAAGVLVGLAIVAPLAITGVITTLIGLGPLGWLMLMLLISQAPVATVAGGALLLAAVTYLVWDATNIRLTIDRPVLRSSVAPDRANDPEEVVLDPDRAELDGDITVSVNSEIPSGIHQIFDTIVNVAITHFDTQVREVLEDVLVEGLAETLRRLPHFRLPQPFDVDVPVAVSGGPIPQVNAAAPRHRLLGADANGVPQWLLSAAATTRVEFPFPGFSPTLTQVDRDLREKLTARVDDVEANGGNAAPWLGYGISQNLLNGIVHAQWLAGRFERDYDEGQVETVFATLIAARPECEAITGREVHVWAAAAPTIAVTERIWLEDPARPYLAVSFPDIRVCISGVAGKASTLELSCSAHSIAHIALGGRSGGGLRTLLTVEHDFVHVLFDDRSPFVRVSAQGLETQGPGYDAIAALDDASRLQLLQGLQPIADAAARRLLRRNNVDQVVFAPGTSRVDEQRYDGIAAASFVPRRASVLVVVTTFGPITTMLPRLDQQGRWVMQGMDFDTLDCDGGIDFRTTIDV